MAAAVAAVKQGLGHHRFCRFEDSGLRSNRPAVLASSSSSSASASKAPPSPTPSRIKAAEGGACPPTFVALMRIVMRTGAVVPMAVLLAMPSKILPRPSLLDATGGDDGRCGRSGGPRPTLRPGDPSLPGGSGKLLGCPLTVFIPTVPPSTDDV